MEIILKEDILNLGFKNDIVNVKPGYARNFLIPTGKAIIASPSAKKMLAEDLRQKAHKLAKMLEEAQAVAESMEGVSVTIPTKVSATGAIYGSVNTIMVAEALAAKGFEVDRKKIQMKETIKQVGTYTAYLRLHKEVTVEVTVEVVSDAAAPVAAEASTEEA